MLCQVAALVLALTARTLVARRDDGGIKRQLAFEKAERIAGSQRAAMQHARKHALTRHDAVADRRIDGAVRMALLANLRDFEDDIA